VSGRYRTYSLSGVERTTFSERAMPPFDPSGHALIGGDRISPIEDRVRLASLTLPPDRAIAVANCAAP
jgi:hypothetical protein